MPIFVYAAPVTGTAAMALTLVAAATETAAAMAAGVRGGMVGWALSGRYAALVVYLALVPGIIGHTGFNTLLRCVWGEVPCDSYPSLTHPRSFCHSPLPPPLQVLTPFPCPPPLLLTLPHLACRYLTPLSVALAVQLEPLVGSLIGWMAGLVPAPGWADYVGGVAVLLAAGMVTVGRG